MRAISKPVDARSIYVRFIDANGRNQRAMLYSYLIAASRVSKWVTFLTHLAQGRREAERESGCINAENNNGDSKVAAEF